MRSEWTVLEDKAERAVEAWKENLGAYSGPGRPIPVSDDETTIYGGSRVRRRPTTVALQA